MNALFTILKDKLKALGEKPLTEADLDALAADPDVAKAFDEDTEAAVNAATEGLARKNTELLKEKKALQIKVKDGTKESLDDLEETITKLTEQNEELSRTVQSKDKLLKTAESRYNLDTKGLNDKLTAERNRADAMLMDNALSEGLGKITIDPAMKKIVGSHLRGALTIVEDSGERRALARYLDEKGKEVQLPFAEYVEKVWAPSDEGKAVIKSKASGGARDDTGGRTGKGEASGGAAASVNPFDGIAFSDGTQQS